LFGAHWAFDGNIYFSQETAILRVPATGGIPELLIQGQAGERFASLQLLPDGDTLLFSATTSNWDNGQIFAQSLNTGARTVQIERGTSPRYVSTGHLIYAVGSNLFAVAFDMVASSVTGSAVPVAQGVLRGNASETANFDVTTDGALIYMEGTAQSALRTLVWVDRKGSETAIPIEPSIYTYPRISPDGQRVALDDRNAASDIWIWDFAAQTRTRFNTGISGGHYPVWTVDRTGIAFGVPGNSINLRTANNTGQTTTLLTSSETGLNNPYFFSPSGQELVYRNIGPSGDDVFMLSLNRDIEPIGLLKESFSERNAELSPNGRWMAYQSDESGSFEIYVRPFPNVDEDKIQVSNAGGIKPLWSRDGSELFYMQPGSGTPHLMAVTVKTDGTSFAFGSRTALLDLPYVAVDQGRNYDVSLDGQQFLAIKPFVSADPPEGSSRQVIITQNWIEELKRLLPN
jgi:eukaryotic-like serine/threonine-protein kinase